ncbi:MAG: hypothetical protein EOM29_00820 [Bacteroidia bacterium]|nr:hypothetical protein [Bacteroidia bacterium]
MSKIFGTWKKKYKDAQGNVTEKYYACPRTTRVIDEDILAEEIAEMSSLTQGDVLSAISALSSRINAHLKKGASVKLKGIGVFGIWLTSEGYDNPKDINPKKVRASKVTFRPDRGLVKSIKEMKFDNMPKLPKGLVAKKG